MYYNTLPLDVFCQRNFVADIIQLKLTFIPKKGKVSFMSHPLGDYVRTSTIARWKARVRLRIHQN